MTERGALIGTPPYMSPEQVQGGTIDARSDIFSFGVLLYEMLTGARPFKGESTFEVLYAIMNVAPLPLRRADGVPDGLRAVVERCLAKDPNARFTKGQELFHALRAVASIPPDPDSTGSGNLQIPPSGALPADLAPTELASSDPDLVSAPAPKPVDVLSTLGAVDKPRSPFARGKSHARARWLLPAAGVLALGAAVAVVSLRRESTRNGAAASAASSAPRASGPGIPITSHPVPRSLDPRAGAAYVSALQSLRNGASMAFITGLRSVVKLDPTVAAAQLRIALTGLDREAYQAAWNGRDNLDPRDVALLSVAETATEAPFSRDKAHDRAAQVAAEFPDDAEVAYFAGVVKHENGSLAGDAAALRRAVELDPKFAGALASEAETLYYASDLDAALRVADQCLAIAPRAPDCLNTRVEVHSTQGDCRAALADAETRTQLTQTEAEPFWDLATLLAATGAPIEAVRAAVGEATHLPWSAVDPAAGDLADPSLADFALALLAGDLPRAEAAMKQLDAARASRTEESAHTAAPMMLMDIAEEEGDASRALTIARTFVRSSAAWAKNEPGGVRTRLLYLEHARKAITDAEFTTRRDELYESELRSTGWSQGVAWRWSYLEFASTPGEIDDAIARLAAHGPLESIEGTLGYALGRVYFLHGDWTLAIPPLRGVTTGCELLNDATATNVGAPITLRYVRANTMLGEALEHTGDKPGACKAYRSVTTLWKDARPRSVTLERAKARAAALGCPG